MELSLEGSTHQALWYLQNQQGCVNERGTLLPRAGKNRRLWNIVHLVLNRWVWEAARLCIKRNKAKIQWQWQKYSYVTEVTPVFGSVPPMLRCGVEAVQVDSKRRLSMALAQVVPKSKALETIGRGLSWLLWGKDNTNALHPTCHANINSVSGLFCHKSLMRQN